MVPEILSGPEKITIGGVLAAVAVWMVRDPKRVVSFFKYAVGARKNGNGHEVLTAEKHDVLCMKNLKPMTEEMIQTRTDLGWIKERVVAVDEGLGKVHDKLDKILQRRL